MQKSSLFSRLLGAASILGLLGCTQPSLAARPSDISRLVEVTVVNRTTGQRLTPYRHHGRLYVAGTPGDPYQIELRSRIGGRSERVLTVLSVDGVNVLTGDTAAPLQSGYVLDGWQSYSISGWRKTMDDVAQFVFTALPDSYAARTGRPGNVGVIGVAVFREKAVPVPVPYSPSVSARRAENALDEADDGAARARQDAPAPSAKAAGAVADSSEAERAETRSAPGELRKEAKKLGTGHGEREYSPTRYTKFVRAGDAPDEIITIYYDSRANLIARGVIPSPRLAEPQPFPGNPEFVPDPRG